MAKEFNIAVGHTLRRIRQDKFLTLRQVSASSYVALGHISDIETGRKSPSLATIEQVCTKGLGIEMTMLMKEIYKTLQEQ